MTRAAIKAGFWSEVWQGFKRGIGPAAAYYYCAIAVVVALILVAESL